MAKFSILNALSRGKSAPNTVNFENGRAYKQTAKVELVSILLTTFLQDEFYFGRHQYSGACPGDGCRPLPSGRSPFL
jgi:hypothetical protein